MSASVKNLLLPMVGDALNSGSGEKRSVWADLVRLAIRELPAIVAKLKESGAFDDVIGRAKEAYHGKRIVLVFGCTGTGKTSMIKSLADPRGMADKIPLANRTNIEAPHPVDLDGIRFIVFDTPGSQEAAKTVNAVTAPFKEGNRGTFARIKGIGIINVVSYGYHEYSEKGRAEFVVNSHAVNPAALDRHRHQEVRALEGWASRIEETGTQIDWVITAVNKADLWADNWETVKGHYQDGEYQRILERYLGSTSKLIITRYCSALMRFYETVPMSGTLEEGERWVVYKHFCDELIKIGAAKPARRMPVRDGTTTGAESSGSGDYRLTSSMMASAGVTWPRDPVGVVRGQQMTWGRNDPAGPG
jgi:hypothetical protein